MTNLTAEQNKLEDYSMCEECGLPLFLCSMAVLAGMAVEPSKEDYGIYGEKNRVKIKEYIEALLRKSREEGKKEGAREQMESVFDNAEVKFNADNILATFHNLVPILFYISESELEKGGYKWNGGDKLEKLRTLDKKEENE